MQGAGGSSASPSFGLRGNVAVVTGGSGVLGRTMAGALAGTGARVAVLARRMEPLEAVCGAIGEAGGQAMAVRADVQVEGDLREAANRILDRWGRIDIQVNAAGGTAPASVVPPDGSFFDLSPDALRQAVDLNLMGTVLPCLVFGSYMAANGSGSIVNISSMSAALPLTRVVGYAAAKAGVENFTRWLAVELARRHSPGIRVNAIAPGFLLGDQNRHLLTTDDGGLTERGKAVIQHTPAGRFGDPADLTGPLVWLCSPAAAFVTGAVIPVDGGFSAWWGL